MRISHIFNGDIENYHIIENAMFFYRRERIYFGKLLVSFKKMRELFILF